MNALAQSRLFDAPAAGLYPLSVPAANELLTAWGHKLGPCERPFHSEAFAFELHGEPIAVAISASIVGVTAAGYPREQVVELARQAARERWANRVMIRLWREICAPAWPCWPVWAAVSYSKNSTHSGDLYRFDGWRKVREDCGSSGGGTWSSPTPEARSGSKTLWCFDYPQKRVMHEVNGSGCI